MKDIERKASVKVKLSKDGVDSRAEISGEPAGEWLAEQALFAVGLGFAPKDALKLLGDKHFLEVIDLEQLFGGNERSIGRYKARVIGTEGKVKAKLEELSGAVLALSDGPQIGVLGEFDDVRTAKEAVIRILEGGQHGGVFVWLKGEKRRKEAEAMGLNIKRGRPVSPVA